MWGIELHLLYLHAAVFFMAWASKSEESLNLGPTSLQGCLPCSVQQQYPAACACRQPSVVPLRRDAGCSSETVVLCSVVNAYDMSASWVASIVQQRPSNAPGNSDVLARCDHLTTVCPMLTRNTWQCPGEPVIRQQQASSICDSFFALRLLTGPLTLVAVCRLLLERMVACLRQRVAQLLRKHLVLDCSMLSRPASGSKPAAQGQHTPGQSPRIHTQETAAGSRLQVCCLFNNCLAPVVCMQAAKLLLMPWGQQHCQSRACRPLSLPSCNC